MASKSAARRESVNLSLISKAGEKAAKAGEKETVKTPQKGEKNQDGHKSDTKTQSKKKDDQVAAFDSFKEEIKSFFEKYDRTLDQKLDKFNEKFTNMFAELKREVSSMRTEVHDTKTHIKDLKSRVDDMEKALEYQAQDMEEKDDRQSNELNKYVRQLEELQEKLLIQERHDRRYNLLFYGFAEHEEENLEIDMKTFFEERLEIPKSKVDAMLFANLHRIPTRADGPNPVIIKFVRMADRDEVFNKAFHPILKDEKKRILSDLPVFMKRERGKLATIAYKIRQTQKKQTRIVERGLSLTLEVRRKKGEAWKEYDGTVADKSETENTE